MVEERELVFSGDQARATATFWRVPLSNVSTSRSSASVISSNSATSAMRRSRSGLASLSAIKGNSMLRRTVEPR